MSENYQRVLTAARRRQRARLTLYKKGKTWKVQQLASQAPRVRQYKPRTTLKQISNNPNKQTPNSPQNKSQNSPQNKPQNSLP